MNINPVIHPVLNCTDLPAAENGLAQLSSPSRSSAVGLRREGDVAGVRQMHSNAPRSQVASAADIMALTKRVIIPQFSKEESLYDSSVISTRLLKLYM